MIGRLVEDLGQYLIEVLFGSEEQVVTQEGCSVQDLAHDVLGDVVAISRVQVLSRAVVEGAAFVTRPDFQVCL